MDNNTEPGTAALHKIAVAPANTWTRWLGGREQIVRRTWYARVETLGGDLIADCGHGDGAGGHRTIDAATVCGRALWKRLTSTGGAA